ncbi:MAG: DUF4142 domain-containing protein [Proteobacteria bacterium]|nr:DUF4142 domain-containing protein [Pseudomonadota bacterium]
MKTYSLLGIIAAVALGVTAGSALGQSQSAHARAGDSDFVRKAGEASLAEIDAGTLAVKQSGNADVRDFGQRMIDDHRKAYDELKSAAGQGYTVPGAPNDKQRRAAAKLERLSGPAFDRAYAKQMVADHEDAVKLFGKEAHGGHDNALVSYARATLPTLEQHLAMSKRLAGAVDGNAHRK